MDLVCANKAKTNSMLIPYYVASGVAGFLFFAMPDRYGRKLTMNVNLGVQVFAQFLALLVPTYGARFTAFVLYGLCQLRACVIYIWSAELV